MQRLLPLTLVIAILSLISTYAQTPGIESPVCNAQFAQLLVEQQVMESKSVVEPIKRIKILIRSADFLWKFDQPKARGYFGEAYKMANDRFKETGFESKEVGEKGKGMTSILPDQRMEVIGAIAKRDAVWAKKLSEQMLADYDKGAADRDKMNKMRELEDLLSLAGEMVKTNPELSRYLYRRVMRYPLFNHWFFAFYRIYKDDPAFADSIYIEALRNYRNETPRRLLYLSAYPFANERIFGVDKYTLSMDLPANVAANPTLQRQFIDTFFVRIANYAASEEDMNRVPEKNSQSEPVYMVSAIREIEPIVIERFPDMLQRLSIAKSQAFSLLSGEMRKQLDDKNKWTDSLGQSVDERLEMIEKADSEGKLTDYMIVGMITWGERTEEQYARILPWLDKIKDENVRRETTNYFWFLRTKLAIKEKRLEDAEKYTLKVPEPEHRALLMFNMADSQSKNAVDVSNLFETLNRLSKLTHSADNSVAKAQILMGLANMYEKVNHSIALDELGEAIRVTNSLKDPDIFATSVRRQISGKNFSFFAMLDTPGYDLEKTFEELSKKDFEMSLANAKALDDKYFRTLAVIAVATDCTKNSKPVAKPKEKL